MTAFRFWTLTCNGCGAIWDDGTPDSLVQCKAWARAGGWATGRLSRDPDWCPTCKGQGKAAGR